MGGLPYREFYYPLNVFMHILTNDEGSVDSLHYGLFESDDEPIGKAQQRSTALLFEKLPPPPSRILEVGIGLGTTLARLARAGYDAQGITPDENQVKIARERFPEIHVTCSSFESFAADSMYDCLVFQESSQYIDSATLFAKAAELASEMLVLDEFAVRSVEGISLHALDRFLTAARMNGFRIVEEIDLSSLAAPTVDYFTRRLPQWRERLISDLSLTSEQVDELIRSGAEYRERYRNGTYAYRFVKFKRI